MGIRIMFAVVLLSQIAFAQGHKINVKIKNLNDSVVYLARYFGDNRYIKDTIVTEGKDKFVIEGEEPLKCGIYLIVLEKRNKMLEFLVDEQEFSIISDTTDLINKTTFKNSPNNVELYKYFSFTAEKGKERERLMKEKEQYEEEGNTTEAGKVNEQLQKIGKEVSAYVDDFMKNNPDNPMTTVFKLQKEVSIPENLKSDDSKEGERKQYYFYVNHYWDNVDFSSECLLRTPLFHGKLQRYFDNVVPQHYDSIIQYIDPLIEKTRVNEELFKYVVNYLTFKWESGKDRRMCMDKVFYHLATKHYLTGEADWVDDTRMAKIKSRVKDLEHFLCGDTAVNLKMRSAMVSGKPAIYDGPGLYDTTGTLHAIHDIKADYTILWFWDSDCGHCKKQTPKLWDMYEKYKEEGKSVEVYAVNIESSEEGYLKYIREKGYTWINVQDTAHLSSFRDYYDIYSTPVAVVLDKDKRIIGKRIDPEAIDRMLEQEFKMKEED